MPSDAARRLSDTYLELRDDGSVSRIPLTPEFWPDLMSGRRKVEGRLITASRIAEDVGHWEMHPAGDEILLLLSGRMTVVLERPEGDEEIALEAGQACIVPRGRWHRVKVREPGELVFMTAGDGTDHKPL